MPFATLRTRAGTRAARIEGDLAVPLNASDVGALLGAAGLGATQGLEVGEPVPLVEADLAPVVPNPGKILCIGHNYREHIRESGVEIPEYPQIFAKFSSSLLGAQDELVLPSVSTKVDWEAELGVVIGRPVRRETPSSARDAIAGYVVVNDVSMRDWQFRTKEVLQGKAFDASTPIGPYLVTPEEIDDASDLEVRCDVDGSTMQCGRTSDMVFTPADLVSYVSQFLTLRPGDLISTGTPSGVGFRRDPQVFLEDGQVLRTTVEGVGTLTNTCRKEM
jgi:acylpyruvate hydrolase